MKKKGSFLGLVPLLIFLLIYASTGIFTDKIDNMPLLVAFTITVAIALCFNNPNKEKISFEQKVEIFCKGASDSTLLLLVIIFLLAGAFYSVADAMGAVKSMVNLGLTLLPLKMLLPGLFIIGCILSFAMGTSMGTVSALTPIAVGIANETGISLPLICGVVVGGAMFGDNLSFISDTTIAATRTQEVEMKDKKLRIEDALNATRAAVEEGIVAGGGTILLDIIESMKDFNETGEIAMGIEIVKRALEAPIKQIAENCGLNGGVVLEKVRMSPKGFGFDARNEKFVNMIESGIIDPAKVTRAAIQNSTSVASLLLTTEVVIANKKEEEKAPMGAGGMMPGMM